ncbi:Transcription-repair-coupling factor [Sebaldella termitidis]|uniref:Transcription-repair-coupling factor n=1 Tax=Sebaldella termitidis (strain ATCC 33386 / NCTC 11300) TaxID=526218 RepID=D1AJR8_SEBTE|nr:DEAD/DEAH box helicase [Sebaldella termitidis]ACZ06975.1 DEAD/DEAH box helicase domain protein [Sebaldella termitidis ATCC 33386]SUI22265.1 Transcription-repair-coupling factor [Sebaldella termitidis]
MKDLDIELNKNKLYRGSIPSFLSDGKNKKIIYISTSNRNLENYHYSLDKDYKGNLNLFENISSNAEDMVGININLLNILKNDKEYLMLVNLQIALSSFFEDIRKEEFQVGKTYSIKEISDFLTENNYDYNYMLEKKGEWSKRGDIVDIFPPSYENPVRMEFFDDELESIRFFDIDTQKSISKTDRIEIYSNIPQEGRFEFIELLDEIKAEDVLVYLENDELIEYKIEEYILLNRDNEDQIRKRYTNLLEKGEIINLMNFSHEQLKTFQDKDKLIKLSEKADVEIHTLNTKKLKEVYKGTKIKVVEEELLEGYIADGKFVLTERELDGVVVQKKVNTKKQIKYKDLNQIREDDYVIHEQYGVGKYKGIEQMNNRDYLKIKYADEDILFIPIEHLDRLEKYISYGEEPKVYKLGTKGFKYKKKKLEEEIRAFAEELVKIQAIRASNQGFVYSKDTVWQEEFEEEFPFVETEDQKRAIEDVKNDMESDKIMDRVICGDVGYGKTEVAMRAAFKAIVDGKQVALLTPTTILAEQHYERFKQRFSKYPMTIENLSRLSDTKKVREILHKLETGVLDMVIGTHRILSEDVKFKNLNLLIIDEEQKFGVKSKEKLKKKREKIDILTLTATPIPRTLNLTLLGIRDISVIETPPVNRVPIETIIEEQGLDIKRAVLKELARDGQIFYIYNNVKFMEDKMKELKSQLPEFVKIDYIHGQLPPKLIKERIKKFENGEYDILMATTIIENGIDISNVNTIFIENFDKLGLSQVYQLRGRVGRSNRQSYCYLIKSLISTKKSKKREETFDNIEDATASGMQLSLEDLKIRGAGEILGEKQHGTIETFGYDLYVKMLRKEIEIQKGTYVEAAPDVNIELKDKGFIPDSYIEADEKLNIYKRFIMLNNEKDLAGLLDEVKDRFGKFPEDFERFVDYMRLKIFAQNNNIKKLREKDNMIEIEFSKNISQEHINVLLLEDSKLNRKTLKINKNKLLKKIT